jgi:twitching motility protein PilT
MDLMQLLKDTVERNASDLHLKVARPPLFRVSGDLMPDEKYPAITEEDIEKAFFPLLNAAAMERFKRELEADLALDIPDLARFRINLFHQRGKLGAVLRRIPLDIPNMEELGLPEILKELALRKQGWVLICGPTGSGKSTTMAAMVEYINRNRACHIVTIEDPVEVISTDKKSTINQRQLGTDTLSFDEALRRVLRQDPDVILMGEMRDAKSMEIAMHAAETGHLVFSTIHTNDAKQTLDRVMDAFAADKAQQIRQLFSQTLAGIVAQKLIRLKETSGLVVTVEVLINSPHMSQLLADNKIGEIQDALQKGGDYYQMQSFNQDLARLVGAGTVTPEEALAHSPNPGDLKLLLRGVGSGSDHIRKVGDRAEKSPRKAAPAGNGNGNGNGDAAAAAPAEGAASEAPAKEEQPKKRLADTRGFTF